MKSTSNQVALVTGATHGIGYETALGLAKMGMRVLMVGRDLARLPKAVGSVRQKSGNDAIEGFRADLTSQSQVRALADEVCSGTDRLHILVNNAGGWFGSRELTADGLERTWALNHLAVVLLSTRLLKLMKNTGEARIVNVASNLYRYGRINWDDLNGAKKYRSLNAYSQSKLAVVLFTFALARRLDGSGVSVNAVHPGAVATGMGKDMVWWMRRLNRLAQCFFLSPARGAMGPLHVATSPNLANLNGQYFHRTRMVDHAWHREDIDLQERLFHLSLQQAGCDEFEFW